MTPEEWLLMCTTSAAGTPHGVRVSSIFQRSIVFPEPEEPKISRFPSD